MGVTRSDKKWFKKKKRKGLQKSLGKRLKKLEKRIKADTTKQVKMTKIRQKQRDDKKTQRRGWEWA